MAPAEARAEALGAAAAVAAVALTTDRAAVLGDRVVVPAADLGAAAADDAWDCSHVCTPVRQRVALHGVTAAAADHGVVPLADRPVAPGVVLQVVRPVVHATLQAHGVVRAVHEEAIRIRKLPTRLPLTRGTHLRDPLSLP